MILAAPERALMTALAAKYPQKLELICDEVSIKGYHAYIVEQWLTDRDRICKTICVLTGDPKHQIICCLVKQLDDAASMPEVWQNLLKAHQDQRSRAVEIQELGCSLNISTLNSVSSLLNLLLVGDGDFDSHWQTCVIQVNLKRMACIGRSAVSLALPTAIQMERFAQIYGIQRVQLSDELILAVVKVCQNALFLLGLIKDAQLVDGLLCDITRDAVLHYRQLYGPFVVVVRDCILDQPVVASLLSKVLSLRTKLSHIGHVSNQSQIKDVPKNPFSDYDDQQSQFMSTVKLFQRWRKLPASGILDIRTVEDVCSFWSNLSPPHLRKARQIFTPNKFNQDSLDKFSHKETATETQNLEEFIRIFGSTNDSLRAIWGHQKQRVTPMSSGQSGEPAAHDVLFEGAQMAENLIQNSRKLLKNVATKATKLPDLQRERQAIRGIKDGVVESFSRFSTQVEEFKDRRFSSKRRSMPVNSSKFEPAASYENMQLFSHQNSNSSTTAASRPFASLIRRASLNNLHNDMQLSSQGMVRSISEDQDLMSKYEFQNFDDCYVVSIRRTEQIINVNLKKLTQIRDTLHEQVKELQTYYQKGYSQFVQFESDLASLQDEVAYITSQIEKFEVQSHRIRFQLNILEDKMVECRELSDTHKDTLQNVNQQIDAGLSKLKRYEFSYIAKALWPWQKVQ